MVPIKRIYIPHHNPWQEIPGSTRLSPGKEGDSMVPMLRPGLLRISSGGWDKRGVSSQPPDKSLSKPGLSMRTIESPEIPQP